MSIESEVASLTAATVSLLDAVNVSKATLDQKVAQAQAAQQDIQTNWQDKLDTAAEQAGIAGTAAQTATTAAGTAVAAKDAALVSEGNTASALETMQNMAIGLSDVVYDYLVSLGKIVFAPPELFLAGGDGAWHDFNAADALFQDSAGTTPATIGDPVAYVLDSSGNANPALQDSPINTSGLTSLGYQYLTDLSASTALTLPSGTLQVILRPVGQTIRWVADASTVTAGTGTALAPPGCLIRSVMTTTLANIRVIEETAGASLHVHYYG